jgi:hypothetical protein
MCNLGCQNRHWPIKRTQLQWMTSISMSIPCYFYDTRTRFGRSENREYLVTRPELDQTIPVSKHFARSSGICAALLGGAILHVRWSARFDIDCLGDFCRFSGLLDHEMQHALVEVCVDRTIFGLERQRHRSVE